MPKYLYPLSSVLFNYIIFLISLIVLVAVGLVRCLSDGLYVRSGGSAVATADTYIWLWNDISNAWGIFPRFGISVECSANASNVYLCYFLLSRAAVRKWIWMDFAGESALLYYFIVPKCSIWTTFRNDSIDLCYGV